MKTPPRKKPTKFVRSESQPFLSEQNEKVVGLSPAPVLYNSPLTVQNIFETSTQRSPFLEIGTFDSFSKPPSEFPRILSPGSYRSVSAARQTSKARFFTSQTNFKETLHPMTAGERKNYNKNKAVLLKVKAKIGRLMKECEDIEESAAVSKKLLHHHSKNILKCFEDTETVSNFINKDKYFSVRCINNNSFACQERKAYWKKVSPAKIYYKLNKRQEKILKDVDIYFDVLNKYTKEESKAYLAQVEETRTSYVNKLAKYAKDSRKRRVGVIKGKPNAPYLAYAEKVVSKISGK